MLYIYGTKLGIKLLIHGRLKWSLRYLIVPANYWRALEYRMVYDEGAFQRTDRVLDIGSPKILSLYLARKLGAEVFATDIDDYFVPEYTLLRQLEGVSPYTFHIGIEDGRRLSFPDHSFNKVYAISVIEHIPDTGDTECMQEIRRVLAPGGRCIITVPFWPTSRTDYKKASEFYWAASSRTVADGRVFFQRRYSEKDLWVRLIEPSGLALRKLQYIGERVLTRSRREVCDFLPRITGPVQPLLSQLLHTPPTDSWRDLRKPLCALIVLEKPA
jgi:SAM-dependent methyltransferase